MANGNYKNINPLLWSATDLANALMDSNHPTLAKIVSSINSPEMNAEYDKYFPDRINGQTLPQPPAPSPQSNQPINTYPVSNLQQRVNYSYPMIEQPRLEDTLRQSLQQNNFDPNIPINKHGQLLPQPPEIPAQYQSQSIAYNPSQGTDIGAQIDVLKRTPNYQAATKDPFSTNQELQNALAKMSGLQVQQQQERYQLPEQLKNDPYAKWLQDQFQDVNNRSSYNWNPQEAGKIAQQLSGMMQTYQTQKPAMTFQQQQDLELAKKGIVHNNNGSYEYYGANANNNGKLLTTTQVGELSSLNDSINSLDQIRKNYSGREKSNLFGIGGTVKRNTNFLNTDSEVNNYNQDLGIARQIIAKEIEKGRLSDSDRAFYQKVLFNPNASQQDFLGALDKFVTQQKNRYNTRLTDFGSAGYNVSGFSGYTSDPLAGIKQQGLQQYNKDEAIAELKRRGAM